MHGDATSSSSGSESLKSSPVSTIGGVNYAREVGRDDEGMEDAEGEGWKGRVKGGR
jgi:hypothetical protein